MCGIAGVITTERNVGGSAAVKRMLHAQRHRGPDGEGLWSARVGHCDVTLGFVRLAIIDLSVSANQPMFLPDGTQGVIFNGEVYNYKELRKQLQQLGVVFRTLSDTEVVLWSLATWGEEAFSKFNGMWALAWINLSQHTVVLSRDRFGVKPLYLYRCDGTLFFASEVKGILAGSGARFRVNTPVVGRFLCQSLLDAQAETFFARVEALPAGHNLRIYLESVTQPESVLTRYWTLEDTLEDRGQDVSEESVIEGARDIFLDAVKLRLRSDVPVGILLSGGLDSSSIAAAMRLALGADADLHAISAISGRREYDETAFIDIMGRHLVCPVHYVHLEHKPEEWFDLLEDVIYANDEPVGSFSPVAHYLLMEEARRCGITVILSGQGGDENLCGYSKFLLFYLQQLCQSGHWISAAALLGGFTANGTVLRQFKISEAKRYLPSSIRPARIDVCGPALSDRSFVLANGLAERDLTRRQQADLEHLSVPALVHYEDRTSMAWSREIRLPYLDYRFVQFLMSVKPEWKLRNGWTKWVFRRAMESYLPKSIVWRKDKQGFTLPQAEWLKHELQERVENFIHGDLLAANIGLVDREAFQECYEAYRRQPANRGWISFKDIFNVLAVEIWLRRFQDNLELSDAESVPTTTTYEDAAAC